MFNGLGCLILELKKTVYPDQLLEVIQTELQLLNAVIENTRQAERSSQDFVSVPFNGSEIYHKKLLLIRVDENYKSLLEKTVVLLPIKVRKDSVHIAFASTVIKLIRKQRIM